MSIETKDLLNWSTLSQILVGKKDVLRAGRVQRKHKESVQELLLLLDYWRNKYDKN